MNLAALLAERACAVKSGSTQPVRVGIIGAGKFGSMVLAQLRHLEGLQVVAVADLDVKKHVRHWHASAGQKLSIRHKVLMLHCAKAQPVWLRTRRNCSVASISTAL